MKKYSNPEFSKIDLNIESAILSGSNVNPGGGEGLNINREESTSQPLFYRPQVTPFSE